MAMRLLDKQKFKNKFINYLRFHQKTVVMIIVLLFFLFAGFFIYNYILRIIWFAEGNDTNDHGRLNLGLYDEMFNDFAGKSDRFQQKINRIHRDPFR